MTSIRDIAKLSGCSISTVSRVLNHHPHVSDEMKQKVLDVIHSLDYTPNLVAKDLSLGITHKVGVVIPHTRHPYFTQVLNGLMDAASKSQYQLLLLPSHYETKIEMNYLEQLRGHAFDSLIFTSRHVPLQTIETYQKYGKIVCAEQVTQSQLSSIYIQREKAYHDAFNFLKDKNFKHIALLFTRADKSSTTFRVTS